MEWQDWSKRLTEVLELKNTPVAVTYTDQAPAGASSRKARVCGAIHLAAGGQTIALTAENSACPGGSLYLGLRAQPPEQAKVLREFLIEGEKLFSCPAAIHRTNALAKVKPPLGAAEYVVLGPLDQAELPPDVTVFVCNAWQAARLVNLAYYETGLPMECDPTGALCRAVITYPWVTGKVNVSFGDVTARRSERVSENELYVSMPFSHLRSVVWSLDRCGAGTAPIVIPPGMRRMMHEAGGEPLEV